MSNNLGVTSIKVVMDTVKLAERWLALLAVGLIFIFFGCSARPHIKPRSELLKESAAQGIYMPSLEQERVRYEYFEKQQVDRLTSLMTTRQSADFKNPNYLIGAGDEIEINVFDVPELNVTVRVRQSGFISLPLIGAVKAAGMTEQSLAKSLKARMKDFMHHPEVSVFISNYGSQKVSVIGAVYQPGSYTLKKGANSILELIGQAGGLTDKAGSYLNFIPGDLAEISKNQISEDARFSMSDTTQAGLNSYAIEVPLEKVMGTRGGIPLKLAVQDGDMIIVPEAGMVQVDGEVIKSGTYILGNRMTLLGALASAGGITYGAKFDEVEVIRDLEDQPVHLIVNLERIAQGEQKDVLLKDGDIVRVPSDDGRRAGQDTFEAISRIINFGVGGTVNLAN